MADLNFPSGEPFPRFQGESLFLASSSDMRHVRHDALAMLDGLLSRLVTEHPIKPYEWETCIAENPFDQRLKMQENLSRPSDPKCVGVICILGERIGFPLEDFDASTIPGWETWSDPKRRYRAVHPWPAKKEEQLKLVKDGGFPLSGTVFEALDALGAGRNTHIAYFADRPVTYDDPDVRLNGRNWRRQISEQLDGDELTDWLDNDYAIQTRGVTNFLNALNERGRDVPVHQTVQEALKAIRSFVETKIAPVRLAEDNPYRFLDFYDILDGDTLPGREEAIRKAVAELRARAASPDSRPMIAQISGESGCGKTSFMRAGILAAFNRPSELGRFRVIAVRPTDFHDENGRPDHNLPARLLEIIAREITDLGLPATALRRVARAGPQAAQLAVEALVDALDAKGKDAPSIVIGLDQFEEILDDLGAIDRRPYAAAWRPLLSFVEIASKTGRFGFVYTLESSRQEVFETVALPEVFRAAYEVRLGGHDDDFLEAIITRPFEKAGYRLSPQIVNALLASYKSYSEKIQGHASSLPLLSLKLSNLFDTVQSLRSVRPRQSSKDGLHAGFEDQEAEISYEELKDELRLDNEIEELANAAWGPSNKNEEEQIHGLNPFLKPLVALSGDDLDKITLQTVAESLFVNLEERLSAFEHVRLVIRENGRRRLVHEAVVRQWPLAAKWLEQKRKYLVKEAKFRTDANVWQAEGESQELLPKDEASINMAAAVLRSYMQEWIYCDPADLSAGDRNLKKYCQAIFQQSTTPSRMDSNYFYWSYAHIHVAAMYGMIELIDRFISKEPDSLELQSGNGSTPLMLAAWFSEPTTRFLLEKGANPVNFDKEGWSTIASAIWSDDSKIFRLLLPYYRTVESIKAPFGANMLHVAARRGAVDMAAALIASVEGIDPTQEDEYSRTPLDFAALFDQPEAFKFFLKYCDVRHQPEHGWTVLHYAANGGSLKVVEEILKLRQFYDLLDAPNNDGETALMVAAKQRRDAVVSRLLEFMGPNVQVQKDNDKKGWTALHYAIAGPDDKTPETRPAHQQALRTVRALLAAPGIDPTIKAGDGKEPIALAASLPHVRRELISHPSFAWGERLSDGSTPLNFIISAKDRHAVERMLREPDLDVEALSSDGTYALSLLIENDMADLAVRLLEEGRVDPWNVSGAKDNGLSAAITGDHEQLITIYIEKLPKLRKLINQSQRRYISHGVKTALVLSKSDALLQKLIELGPDPAFRLTKRGWNLFHYAASVGNIEAFDKLALLSDETSLRDTWGRRPAELAPDHVRAQFEARMKDREDETSAPEQSGAPEAESLPEASTNKAETSETLFALARSGDIEGFTALLANPDVDPTILDDQGRSPAEHAPAAVREKIAELLRHAASDRRK